MTWLGALVSVDQTTICVVLIILSVSLLWIYVTMVRRKTEQPNFNILYEKSSHQEGSKRGLKNKGKSKYVDGSPRPASRNAVVENEDPVALPQHKEILPSKPRKDEGRSKQQVSTKGQNNTEKQPSKTKTQNRPKKIVKDGSKPDEKETAKEVEMEGEWQTQLSRPQLRALRQKQRQSKERREQGTLLKGEVAEDSGNRERNERLHLSASKTGSKGRGKTKAKEEERTSLDLPPDSEGASTGALEVTRTLDTGLACIQDLGGTNNESNSISSCPRQDSAPPPPPATCSDSVHDVESALREAALCGLSGIDDGIDDEKSALHSETVPTKPQKRKKPRRKNKLDEGNILVSNEPRAPSIECDSQDDWVVIN